VTNEAGQVVARYDNLPFGEEIPAGVGGRTAALGYGGGSFIRLRFTGKERDAESGFHYFGTRYMAGAQGRFTSVDPVMNFETNIPEPQIWNRYAYVGNNPLRYVDPDGKERFEQVQNTNVRLLTQGKISQKQFEDRMIKTAPPVLAAVGLAGALGGTGMALAADAGLLTEGMIALGLLGPKVGEMIAGPYGRGQPTRTRYGC
jgi:RHS repeat-associated protein